MLFDFLKDIIYRKKGDLLDNEEAEAEFQPFMIHRWLSFYSPDFAKLLNATTNRLYTIFDEKSDWYKSFLTILPKTYPKRIKYIKKAKKEKESPGDIKVIEFLAKQNQLSQREVREYIDLFNIDTSRIKKGLNIKELENGR